MRSYAGMDIFVKDAQEQMRTPRDVPGPMKWVRPRCPSKLKGRKGTRRGWKRQHSPGWAQTWLYREPEDVVILHNRMVIVTPRQYDALKHLARAQ